MENSESLRTNGPAAAALLAAGVGIFVLGLATTLAAASPAIPDVLRWSQSVGPLSGKTGVAVIAWLVSWPVLHLLWRGQELPFNIITTVSWVLVGLGLIMTFPPFFELFHT